MDDRLRVERLEWDRWNENHIAKHGVTRQEVEEVADSYTISLDSYKGRSVLLVRSRGNRVLAVVVGPVPDDLGAYHCFSARGASRKERRLLNELLGGADA